jgi:hypothetical protein
MVLGTWYKVRCSGDLLNLIEHTVARTTCMQQHIPFKRDDICNRLHAPGLLQGVTSVATLRSQPGACACYVYFVHSNMHASTNIHNSYIEAGLPACEQSTQCGATIVLEAC